ncbi:MAG: hypothetical protein ABJN78_01900, partial [Hyphomicrobiales bacterium]
MKSKFILLVLISFFLEGRDNSKVLFMNNLNYEDPRRHVFKSDAYVQIRHIGDYRGYGFGQIKHLPGGRIRAEYEFLGEAAAPQIGQAKILSGKPHKFFPINRTLPFGQFVF